MKPEFFQIESERLSLIPLREAHLKLLKQSRALMEKSLGLSPMERSVLKEMMEEMEKAMDHWLEFTGKYPEKYFWGTNWEIIWKISNQSVGSIGLSGLPNENGEVAIGYVIDDNFQKKGIASEAVMTMSEWVFRQEEASKIIAYTPVKNYPSQKVLQKNGFENAGQIKEDGQVCYVWKKYTTSEK